MKAINEVHHRSQYSLSLNAIITMIISVSLFLTFVLLMTTNSQFIAFNEFSATGKYPALFYYISIVLIVIYLSSFVTAAFGFWSTKNILNKWNYRNKCLMKLFFVSLLISGVLQLVAGVIAVAYTRTMAIPLREFMIDNLRSNYTGGFGVGYLERQFDRSVDWVQINYQCCGVASYEDYRNGFYYNSFNKYTIVSVVPNSCCVYREQQQLSSQPTRCQMKSVNIYRKGCYDILMWWMECFGTLIGIVTLVSGAISIVQGFFVIMFYKQIELYKREVRRKHMRLNSYVNKNVQNNIQTAKDLFDSITLASTCAGSTIQ